ncbi:MAG: hypothetical protein NC453_22140 [Muribaculum sp.]|nr:hypothetical protein [Muribaculum sp.]
MATLSCLCTYSQEYEVVSFEVKQNDLTARTNPRVDANGRKCAVVKVYADDKIAAVRGAVVGEIETIGMEKQIYLAHDARQMELVFENHYPLTIRFMDYDIPSLTGQMTYICKLRQPTENSTVSEQHNPNNNVNTSTTIMSTNRNNDSVSNYNVNMKSEYYIEKADELVGNRDYERAVSILKDGIRNIPQYAPLYKKLAMVYVELNNISSASDSYDNYMKYNGSLTYNDYIQAAVFAFYAGVENNGNGTIAQKYLDKAENYAITASKLLPDNYKPYKIMGDIAKQKADDSSMEKAAFPMYSKAVVLLESSKDTSRYTSDAKTIYNYIGNYYLNRKEIVKAKEAFYKYLQYDPNNEQYRMFVEGLKE